MAEATGASGHARPNTARREPRLYRPYVSSRSDGSVDDGLVYRLRVRRRRDDGFTAQDVLEPRRPEGATAAYRHERVYEWARRLPSDAIRKARKSAPAA